MRRTNAWWKGARASVPVVLASSLALTMGVTGPVQGAESSPRPSKPKPLPSHQRPAAAPATAAHSQTPLASGSVPATYRVEAGDTVSAIAARYGLATASVLALNGLGWKTTIHPGQELRLTSGGAKAATPTPISSEVQKHTIAAGETISGIAARYGVSTRSVLSANGLSDTSIVYPGQTVVVPAAMSLASSTTPAPAAPAATAKTYTIQPGDTVSAIASRLGVDASTLLELNGLGPNSLIYAGRTLTVPTVTALTSEMRENARIIVEVGRSLGVSDRGLVIALAAAMQESSLRNIDYGDRDSVGLFQQRPSTGWGDRADLLDPWHAARLFFGGPGGPNSGITPGLLDIHGWESMSVTEAAQAVQVSAYPDAYAKWELSARTWLRDLG